MTTHGKFILVGGAAAALLILKSKHKTAIDPKTGKKVSTGLLSSLLPTRGTNSPALASTNMATRGGLATVARTPSSGIGFNSANPRGVAGAPTTATAAVAGGALAFSSLLNFLARKPSVTTSAPLKKPTATDPKSSGGAAGGSSGGGSNAGGGSRSGGMAMGGSAGVAGKAYSDGYFDDNGNWHGYDGYYDADGNFIQTNEDGSLPGLDAGGGGLQATVPDVSPQYDLSEFHSSDTAGATDENGNYDPNADPFPADGSSDDTSSPVLDATQTVPYDQAPDGSYVDPISFDGSDPASGTDDASAAALGGTDDGGYSAADDYAGGGGSEDYGTDAYYE